MRVYTVRGVAEMMERIQMIRMFRMATRFMWIDSVGLMEDCVARRESLATQIARNRSTVKMTSVRTDALAVVSRIRFFKWHAK